MDLRRRPRNVRLGRVERHEVLQVAAILDQCMVADVGGSGRLGVRLVALDAGERDERLVRRRIDEGEQEGSEIADRPGVRQERGQADGVGGRELIGLENDRRARRWQGRVLQEGREIGGK